MKAQQQRNLQSQQHRHTLHLTPTSTPKSQRPNPLNRSKIAPAKPKEDYLAKLVELLQSQPKGVGFVNDAIDPPHSPARSNQRPTRNKLTTKQQRRFS